MVATGSITSNNITFSANTISGNTLFANTVSGTAFQTGSVENYMTSQSLNLGMRNRIINGDMRIDQRNAGASISFPTGDGLYCLDRWRLQKSGSATATIQQVSTAPTGFSRSIKFTVSSGASPSAGDYYTVGQIIEGYNCADFMLGTASAQPITLSFWINSSVTGTYSASLYNWGGGNTTYPATFTINASNTWEYKTITIPGATSGTWATNNTGSIYLRIDLGSGSTFSTSAANAWNNSGVFRTNSSVNFMATTGATLYLTGVQIEKGSTSTPFETRQYGTELTLCQRYFEKNAPINEAVNNSMTMNYYVISCLFSDGWPAFTDIFFKVTKRTAPTIGLYGSATGGDYGWYISNLSYTSYAARSSYAANVTESGCRIQVSTWNGSTGTFQYTAGYSYTAYGAWTAIAEL